MGGRRDGLGGDLIAGVGWWGREETLLSGWGMVAQVLWEVGVVALALGWFEWVGGISE